MLITRHWAHKLPISIGTFYGFAQGPTWPKARQLSDQLLETFTQELVFGMTGVRLIMGDFNQEPEQLTQHHIWMRQGWRNAQHIAEQLLQYQILPTYKGVNERDQIWFPRKPSNCSGASRSLITLSTTPPSPYSSRCHVGIVTYTGGHDRPEFPGIILM